MKQYGFSEGYDVDPKIMDKRLRENDSTYGDLAKEPDDDYLSNVQNLLNQVKQVKAGQFDPSSMGAVAGQQKMDYTPQLASALSQLSAQAGAIDGKTANTSAVSDFANTIQNQRLAQNKEAQSQVALGRKSRLSELGQKLAMAKAARGEQKYAGEMDFRQKKYDTDLALQEDKLQYGMEQDKYKRETDRLAASNRSTKTGPTKTIQTVDEQGNPVTQLVSMTGEVIKSFERQPRAKRPPSESQAKAAGFGRRVEAAGSILDNLATEGYDRTSWAQGTKNAMLTEGLKGDKLQQQNQAERNFVNAVLRRESGAAISPTEFESAELQYFPRAGDSRQTLANKKQNREGILVALRAEAGAFWDEVPAIAYNDVTNQEEPEVGTAYAAEAPVGEEFEIGEVKEVNGETWEYIGNDEWEAVDENPEAVMDRTGNAWRR